MNAEPSTRAWLAWRPSVSQELLALLVSIFFTFACNAAFWRACMATGMLDTSHGWVTLLSLVVVITGLHMLFLCVVSNRWTVRLLLSVLLLLTGFAAYYASHYGVYLDPDMLRNILHTDARESYELLTPGLLLPLVYVAVPVGLIWWVRIPKLAPAVAVIRRLLTMLLVTAVIIGALLMSFQDISALMRNQTQMRYLIAPGNFIASLARVAAEDPRAASRPRRTVGSDAKVVARGAGKPRVLVVVVGETVRAQNWGLNGYARQTTPKLSKLKVLNFTEATSCGSSTEVSLPCMFSTQGRRHYDKQAIRQSESLLNVLDHAGIATLWRDNQGGCKNVCNGLPFESLADAKVASMCDAERCLDEILLQDLQARIDMQANDQVIVLHQMGNHGPSYFRRYPDRFKQFVPACETPDLGKCSKVEIVNAYDNAILYTDEVLARLITSLQLDTSRNSAMIYVSDHGESLGEGNLYLHGVPYQVAPATQLKVPMVIWLSPGMAEDRGISLACMRQRLGEPASHDNLFSSILGLMQVSSSVYERSQDLFAPCATAAHG